MGSRLSDLDQQLRLSPRPKPSDSFIGEKWFIRDDLNLAAEALAQLDGRCNDGERLYAKAVRQP